MDTFMDKLAQKLNAQEMIRANSAAEAEELGNLRNQVAEYNECLVKLQKLLDDGTQKFHDVQVSGEQVNRLVAEGLTKMNEIQKNIENFAEMKALFTELKSVLDSALEEQGKAVTGALEEQKTAVAAAMEEQKTAVAAAMEEQKTAVAAAMEEQKSIVAVKLEDCNENVHKECVKVYRNVQAVVVEENGKLAGEVTSAVGALKGRLKAVLGISITAMILALAGVVLQVLNLMNIKFF